MSNFREISDYIIFSMGGPLLYFEKMGNLVGDFGIFHNFDPEILDFSEKIYNSATRSQFIMAIKY